MPPGDPRIRASDADRDRVATLLREHHSAGRLTAAEYHDRVDAAFAAKTIGDLDTLLADLPAIDLYRLPAAGIKPAPPGIRRPRSRLTIRAQPPHPRPPLRLSTARNRPECAFGSAMTCPMAHSGSSNNVRECAFGPAGRTLGVAVRRDCR